MEGEGCLSRREKSSLTVHSLSISPHVKEKASEGSAKYAGEGGGGVALANKSNGSVTISYPVKSFVLRWRPFSSRFYPCVQR